MKKRRVNYRNLAILAGIMLLVLLLVIFLFSMLFSALFLSQPVKASSAFGAVLVILAGIVTLIGQKRAEARGAGGDNIAKLHKTIYKKL